MKVNPYNWEYDFSSGNGAADEMEQSAEFHTKISELFTYCSEFSEKICRIIKKTLAFKILV